nr:tRNA dimethylallyltransferase 9 isoform X3 [Ipomoea batatas]GMD99309.1 tRNA dimethylallyltransferase 9 isoform X3 [Ipomoea batatas]GME02679.1 tRNA dimethylallyltransferase 9 isoform X3 [Ipomoea batatas]
MMDFCLRLGGFLIWVFCQTQILQLELLVIGKLWNTSCTAENKGVLVLQGTFLPFYLNSRKHPEILPKGS